MKAEQIFPSAVKRDVEDVWGTRDRWREEEEELREGKINGICLKRKSMREMKEREEECI